jgi:hypothetical protein
MKYINNFIKIRDYIYQTIQNDCHFWVSEWKSNPKKQIKIFFRTKWIIDFNKYKTFKNMKIFLFHSNLKDHFHLLFNWFDNRSNDECFI